MQQTLSLLFTFFASQLIISQVVINELDVDTPGTDTQEFIELKTPAANTPLDGYVLVLFNGSTGGMDSSYYALDLDGAVTDENGLLLIGAETVTPTPQLIMPSNLIQQGADAVAIYQGNNFDFPGGTLATATNLIDALVYDTSDPDDIGLLSLLGETVQINENENGNKTTESIQLNNDGTYSVATPTPNAITISTAQEEYIEGDTFNITFTAQTNVASDVTFSFTLNNFGFKIQLSLVLLL